MCRKKNLKRAIHFMIYFRNLAIKYTFCTNKSFNILSCINVNICSKDVFFIYLNVTAINYLFQTTKEVSFLILLSTLHLLQFIILSTINVRNAYAPNIGLLRKSISSSTLLSKKQLDGGPLCPARHPCCRSNK